MIRKLPHCSPRGWPAILSSPALGHPYLYEGDRAAAPRGWLQDRPNRALPGGPVTYDRIENGQQLARDRDKGDLLRLARCQEALIEALEHRVVRIRVKALPSSEALGFSRHSTQDINLFVTCWISWGHAAVGQEARCSLSWG